MYLTAFYSLLKHFELVVALLVGSDDRRPHSEHFRYQPQVTLVAQLAGIKRYEVTDVTGRSGWERERDVRWGRRLVHGSLSESVSVCAPSPFNSIDRANPLTNELTSVIARQKNTLYCGSVGVNSDD